MKANFTKRFANFIISIEFLYECAGVAQTPREAASSKFSSFCAHRWGGGENDREGEKAEDYISLMDKK
jgi:hypothetical protein